MEQILVVLIKLNIIVLFIKMIKIMLEHYQLDHLCRSSDPNEPLSSNVCDVTNLNTERNSSNPGEYRFTQNRFTNTGVH